MKPNFGCCRGGRPKYSKHRPRKQISELLEWSFQRWNIWDETNQKN